jgi:hypothetical protein
MNQRLPAAQRTITEYGASRPGTSHLMARERWTDAEWDAAMEDRPGWVKWLWKTPASRLLLSVVFLAIAIWILISFFTDDDYFSNARSVPALVAAPLLLIAFGAQAVQSIADMVRGTNSKPVFHRLGRWADERLLRRR